MNDWEQMDEFIAITHGEDHVLRSRPLFDWFYLRNADKMKANLIVAYEGKRLIALLGYIPTKFLWGNEKLTGAWMALWMTLEKYRHGIGALLMRKITEMFPIVAGQGAGQMNQAIVTKMGFRFLERIPKVVYLFTGAKLSKSFAFPEKEDIPDRDKLDTVPGAIRKISSKDFSPDWDLYPSLRFGTLRDYEYLRYRYLEYPFLKYLVFVDGPASSPAVCVARIIDTAEGIKVARILEFFYPENYGGESLGRELISKCLNYFMFNNCDYADFYCTADPYIKLLATVGFMADDEGVLPSRLDPIDMSIKVQNFELHISRELKSKYPGSLEKCFVTRADGDQDRPNKSFTNYLNGLGHA